MVIVALSADAVATRAPEAQDISNRLRPPGTDFYFGTDNFGRDVFSRVVYGSRVSLYVGLVSVSIGGVIGVFLGIVSAYLRGKFDLLAQRFVDALMGFPSLVLALVLLAALGGSLNNVVAAVALTFAPRMVRVARGQALAIKEEPYVVAARSIGARPLRIVLRHILPNSLGPLFVLATAYLGTAIIIEASLSYLGLGVPPPLPSWGRMLQEGTQRFFETSPWLTAFPGLALTITVFGFNLFGDALRDVLDPRLRGT